jgi:hypothetical protein
MPRGWAGERQRETTGDLVADTRWEHDDGYIDSWKLAADAFVNTGQLFTVTFLAAAMVADSGDDFVFGYSLARAWIDMCTMFVLVEMGP